MQIKLFCVTHNYNAPAFYVEAADEFGALEAFGHKYRIVNNLTNYAFAKACHAQAVVVPFGTFIPEFHNAYVPDPSTFEGDGDCDREERWVS